MHVCACTQRCRTEQVCSYCLYCAVFAIFVLACSVVLSIGLLIGTLVVLVALIIKKNEAPTNFILLFVFVSHSIVINYSIRQIHALLKSIVCISFILMCRHSLKASALGL